MIVKDKINIFFLLLIVTSFIMGILFSLYTPLFLFIHLFIIILFFISKTIFIKTITGIIVLGMLLTPFVFFPMFTLGDNIIKDILLFSLFEMIQIMLLLLIIKSQGSRYVIPK